MAHLDDIRRWALRIIWIALVAISLPILVDAVVHVATHSWAWYVVAIAPLAIVAVVGARTGPPHGLWAIFGVAAGVAVEVWALASGDVRFGRFGLAVAVVAVLLLQGRADRRNSVLVALCVPIPSLIQRSVCEPLLAQLGRIAAKLSNALGTPAFAHGLDLEWPSGVYRLEGSDLGASAALLGLALGWFIAAGRGQRPVAVAWTVVALVGTGLLAHAIATALLLAAVDPASLSAARPIRDGLAFAATIAVALGRRSRLGTRRAGVVPDLAARDSSLSA
jgi:hypothetical protein